MKRREKPGPSQRDSLEKGERDKKERGQREVEGPGWEFLTVGSLTFR